MFIMKNQAQKLLEQKLDCHISVKIFEKYDFC